MGARLLRFGVQIPELLTQRISRMMHAELGTVGLLFFFEAFLKRSVGKTNRATE